MSQSADRQNGGYPYDQSPSNQYNLYHGGEAYLTAATEQEVWLYLHRMTSCSVHRALRHEGWSVVPVERVWQVQS